VAYGWRQEQLTEHAKQIQDLGRQMYERLWKLVERLEEVRKRIDGSVKAFNDSVGSLNNVLVPAKKFHELGAASGDEILAVEIIENITRELPERKEPVTQLKLKKLAAAAAAGDEGADD